MRLVLVVGLALCTSLGSGCQRSRSKPTREECGNVAEHIAELIIDDLLARPAEWFEAVAAEPGDSGIPPEIDKTTFGAFLATEPGKTWLLQRRGQTLSGAQQGVELCMDNATRPQTQCLLAAKSKAEVVACDQKFTTKVEAPAGSGSAQSK